MQSQHLVKNRILRQLSADELKSMQPWLTLMDLRSNTVLHEQGGPIEQIYFPVSGMVSLLAVMQSGEADRNGHCRRRRLARGGCPHQRASIRAGDGPTGRRCSDDAQGTICRRLS